MKSKTLVAVGMLATVFMLGANNIQVAAGKARQIKDFQDLLSAAERLESAEVLLEEEINPKAADERLDQIYYFARLPKSDICSKHFNSITSVADEFRVKAHNYLDDSKKPPKNPFFSIFGTPLAGMRKLGMHNPVLMQATDRYVAKVRENLVNEDDINCDLTQYQSRTLHAILFILQTDIKYLLTGNQQVINQAIYEQLKADKFVSSNNFYDTNQLNVAQKEILLRFFSDRVNHKEVTLEQAADHFNNPSEYVFGRLIDSCQSALTHQGKLKELELDFNESCPKGRSNPEGIKLFPQQYSFDRFDQIVQFCQDFLDAL